MGSNDRRFIDLHIHSTASDGTLEPLAIIDAAKAAGLSAIALTDHDTTDGCKQVLAQPSPPPLDFLTGVEISADFPSRINQTGSLHILGYDFDIHNASLNRHLSESVSARNNRTPKIIKRLNEIGFDLDEDDIIPFSGGSQTGRPHIAQALLHKGFVSSINEAFDKYIGKNGTAYVDKQRIACEQAIQLISNAGGIPVLAHPGIIGLSGEDELFSLLDLLIDSGLKGIEAYYPGHSEKQQAFYVQLARDRGLLLSGGSDFHGGINPHIKLGKGTGDLFVDYQVYQQLIVFNRNIS